jgi:hypothetical protein
LCVRVCVCVCLCVCACVRACVRMYACECKCAASGRIIHRIFYKLTAAETERQVGLTILSSLQFVHRTIKKRT